MALDSETTLTLPESARMAQAAVEPALRGSVLVLIQFDVCEEIRLDQLRQIFGRPHPGAAQLQALRRRPTFAISGLRWSSRSSL